MQKYFRLLFVIFIYTILSCGEKQKIVIVESRIPKATIVVAEKISEKVWFAAQELQSYLKKVSGAELSIVPDTVAIDQPVISVGSTRFTNEAGIKVNTRKPESFVIQTFGGNLAIIGKDDDGTQFAVYDFLERFLCIRWYWPGALGEVIPEKKTIVLGKIDIREEPDFVWRHRMPIPQGNFPMIEKYLAEVALWEKHNKWGGSMPIVGYHEWGKMVPPAKYATSHPEYYGLVDGKRECDPATFNGFHRCQLCTTNPDVLKIAVVYVRKYFDEHQETVALNISPNDGGGFCECQQCRALDSGHMRTDKPYITVDEMEEHPEKFSVITDRIFTFANQIAERVQLTHPGKYVVNYAYSRYREPPERIKIHPFVMPLYTSWSAYLHANNDIRRKNEKRIATWTKESPNLAIYEYMDNVSWPGFPRMVVPQFAAFIKFLHKNDVRLFQTQSGNGFAINGLNYYVVGKLLWDTKRDEDKILNEFYRTVFKEAAPAMKKFHDRQTSTWAALTAKYGEITCKNFSSSRVLEFLTPEFLMVCRADLNEAAALAQDELTKARVAYFNKGFHYTELSADAIRKARMLEAKGVPMFPQIDDRVSLFETVNLAKEKKALSERVAVWKACLDQLDPAEAKKLVDDALSAWEKRDLYVEDLKNEFIVPYLRIQRNNFGGEFNPRINLGHMYQIIHGEKPNSPLHYEPYIKYWSL